MDDLPPDMQGLILRKFHIRGGDQDPHLKGLVLFTTDNKHLIIVTRQQLLEMADKFREAALSMPKLL